MGEKRVDREGSPVDERLWDRTGWSDRWQGRGKIRGMTYRYREVGRQDEIRWMTGFEIRQEDQISDRVEGKL
jgi:hypothetical protein